MAVLVKKLDAALVCSWRCILTNEYGGASGGEKNREIGASLGLIIKVI
jgi:hypothetical protein